MSTRDAVVTAQDVSRRIIEFIEQDVNTDSEALRLTSDTPLQSQGLDSVKVMSLVFKIEDHYDVLLDEEDADDLRTVGDLAALVLRRIEQQP
jgi:acyl carrier protein